jgi:hypothetical protein
MASTQTAKSAVGFSSFGGLMKNSLEKSNKFSDFFAACYARPLGHTVKAWDLT